MMNNLNEDQIIKWIYTTCILFGSQKSTALKIAAGFAKGFENGQLAISQQKSSNDQ